MNIIIILILEKTVRFATKKCLQKFIPGQQGTLQHGVSVAYFHLL